jgi:hypothetical protein
MTSPLPHHAVTSAAECEVCGGPCRQPFHLDEVPDNYPFMSPADIARTKKPTTPPSSVARGRRRGEGRMRELMEDRMRHPSENR